MKAVIHFRDGKEQVIEHAGGHAITPDGGMLVVFNESPDRKPIALVPFGLGALIYPENDSALVTPSGVSLT